MPVMAGGSPAPLFTREELATYLNGAVSEESAAIAERVASGWLKDAMGVTVWPDEISDQVFAWALELGAIAVETPGGLSTRAIGDDNWGYDREARNKVLTAARGASPDGGASTGLALPRGRFDRARAWPDPAEPRRRWP